MAAEAVAILVQAVDAQADAVAERLVDVGGEADAAVAGRCRREQFADSCRSSGA